MSSVVPEGWSQIKIGDIGSFFGGLTGKTAKDFGEGHPFLTYMQVYLQQTSDVEAMNSVRIDEGEKQNAVAYGDILFTTSSETSDEIGMTDVFLQNNQTPYLNSFCFGLRPITPSPIDPTFGKYVFRGDDFREDMRPLAQGSTRFNLSKGNLAKLSLLVPPLPEQKKIASILTSVDEVIENTQKQIDKLQDLKKATMNELLTKGIGHTEFKDSELGRIPKSWDVVQLKDNLEFISYGFTNPMPETSTGVPMITAKDVTEGSINYKTARNTSREAFDSLLSAKSRPLIGDILLTKDGSLGRLAIVDREDICINQSVAVLRPNEEVSSSFLFHLLEAPLYQKIMMENAGGSTIKHIYITVVDKMKVVRPPCSEQDKIVAVLSSINKRVDRVIEKLSQTQSLKKSLMQDLLTGKVRVTVN